MLEQLPMQHPPQRGKCNKKESLRLLDALGVEEHPTIPCLIEFAKQDSLPLAEQHLAVHHRNCDRRLAGQKLTNVSVSVDELIFLKVLGTHRMIVVLVVGVLGDDIANETPVVVEEARFRLVDDNRGRRVRAVHSDLTVTNARPRHDFAGQIGDIPELVWFRGRKMESLGANGRLF